jgi:hypothetical protein
MNYARSLKLPSENLSPIANPRRLSSIELALAWEIGSQEDKKYVKTFQTDDFEVVLGKPGKEAAIGYERPNPNDMTPTVLYRQEAIDFYPTFSDIFKHFQHLGAVGAPQTREPVLSTLAALMFRSSFMLDHVSVEEKHFNDKSGNRWVWNPPRESLDFLTSSRETMGPKVRTISGKELQLPLDVYLHLIDAIALNEDVKYQAPKIALKGKVDGKVGRTNTLQTLTAIIVVFLDRYPIYKFADSLIRGRGVASISAKAAIEALPQLSGMENWHNLGDFQNE